MTPASPLWTWTRMAAPVANHLWPSTLVAGVAGLLTLTCRTIVRRGVTRSG